MLAMPASRRTISPPVACECGAVLAGELGRLQRKAMRPIEPVAPDHVELPIHGAEFENADPDDGQRFRAYRRRSEPCQRYKQQARPWCRPASQEAARLLLRADGWLEPHGSL